MADSSEKTTQAPAVFRSGRNLQVVGERMEATQPQSPRDAAREAALAAKEQELKAAMAVVRTAFAILGSRALVILAALGSFVAFGWASWEPSGWRVAAAVLFTVLVFLPALWIDRRSPS